MSHLRDVEGNLVTIAGYGCRYNVPSADRRRLVYMAGAFAGALRNAGDVPLVLTHARTDIVVSAALELWETAHGLAFAANNLVDTAGNRAVVHNIGNGTVRSCSMSASGEESYEDGTFEVIERFRHIGHISLQDRGHAAYPGAVCWLGADTLHAAVSGSLRVLMAGWLAGRPRAKPLPTAIRMAPRPRNRREPPGPIKLPADVIEVLKLSARQHADLERQERNLREGRQRAA